MGIVQIKAGDWTWHVFISVLGVKVQSHRKQIFTFLS
jgi:hypothetical protein